MIILLMRIWIKVSKIGSRTHSVSIICIEAVLHFHSCIIANINNVTPVFLLCKVKLHSHKHFERLVCFLLAVFYACLLLRCLGTIYVEIYTVFVAFFEKKLRQGVLLKFLNILKRVWWPVTCCWSTHFLLNYYIN